MLKQLSAERNKVKKHVKIQLWKYNLLNPEAVILIKVQLKEFSWKLTLA